MRIGNRPRVSWLPPGIVRLPAPAKIAATKVSLHETFERSPSRLGMTPFERGAHDLRIHGLQHTIETSPPKKPASPKLHHLPLLPHYVNHPFVHRLEIPMHAIALLAESSSSLTDRSTSPRLSSYKKKTTGYSDAVYYGGRRLSLSSPLVTFDKPQTITVVIKQVQACERVSIDLYATPLDATLADSNVHMKCSPTQPGLVLSETNDSSTTLGSQETNSTKIGDMRVELKGGSSDATIPRLRGGSGHERVSTDTFAFKFKRWVLLCHPCHKHHDDSDDDLPPAREDTPERVVKTRQKTNRRAPLPAHLYRTTPSNTSSSSATQTPADEEAVPPVPITATTMSGLPKRSQSSCLALSSLFHRRSNSPINRPTTVTPAQVLNPPSPQLRGGAESPDKIPPTLSWLAGGTGRKPISFSGWKQSRPKQRMGGLVGMTVFGDKYGQEYKVEAKGIGDVEVKCSASVKVTVDGEVGVKKVDGGAVTSTSSSSSSASSKGKSVREIAAVSEEILPEPIVEPVQRAITPSKVESAKEVAAIAEEVVPEPVVESVQRGLTPPPNESAGDVPLCSGELPVESNANEPGNHFAPSISSEGTDKAVMPS